MENDIILPSPHLEIPGTSLGVGSMVEVNTDSDTLRGVIRWIGDPSSIMTNGHGNYSTHELLVGVELDEEHNDRHLNLTDGTYNNQRYFRCPPKRAIFVHPRECKKDRRFHDSDFNCASSSKNNSSLSNRSSASETKMFGAVDCPRIEGAVPPLSECDCVIYEKI